MQNRYGLTARPPARPCAFSGEAQHTASKQGSVTQPTAIGLLRMTHMPRCGGTVERCMQHR